MFPFSLLSNNLVAHTFDPCASATNDEDWSNNYLITQRYKDTFDDIVPRWHVTPLPVFDVSGNFIKIHELEISLQESLVLVYFKLKHYLIRDKKITGIAGNTFSAIATQVKILQHAAECCSSPYKSQMLKGPTFLPESPTKKNDQISTVNVFHPGIQHRVLLFKSVSNAISVTALTTLTLGNVRDTSRELPLTSETMNSKLDGKKRVMDEDSDATATDDEAPIPDKPPPKKKALHK